ncbi:hypothetical protein MRX96_041313 [Rhipicephalus microplus]
MAVEERASMVGNALACLPHTWYSAVDFQLYLISPIFLYLLYRWPRVGVSISGVVIVVSTISVTVHTSIRGMRAIPGVYNFMTDVYIKPYYRVATYVSGILFSHYIVVNKESISSKKCQDRLGLVTKFLSCSIFAPLSRLVFAVYIAHQPLQFIFFASRQESFDFNYFLMVYFFLGSLSLSFAAAVVLSLAIEMPMNNLQKLVLGRG